MAPRPVAANASADEHHDRDQRHEDYGEDPGHLDPARCAGVVVGTSRARRVTHVYPHSRVVAEVRCWSLRDSVSMSNHDVLLASYTDSVPKLWNETIEAHRRAVRDATLDTTAALVAEHGLVSVTMTQIAQETGIGRATLYKYFSDVEAILVAWHERQIAGHLEHLTRVSDQASAADERLAAVLEAYALVCYEHHGSELAAVLHRGKHTARAEQQLSNFIRELLIEGAATGDLRDDVPPDELASYCLHALTAASGLPSKAAVRRLAAVTLAGLRPPL
jgi:AcrR family transcriptional regulator